MTEPTTSLAEAVKGDRRAALIALRDRLAESIDDQTRPPHTTAPLARQLQAVLKEISECRDSTESSLADHLRERREARQKNASRRSFDSTQTT